MIRLIIDTEDYAGNFEREICAYISGQIGECEVGDIIAEKSKKNIKNLDWFSKHIVQVYSEGCYRPCEIYPTEGWYNNGYGIHIKLDLNNPPKEKFDAYMSVCIFVDTIPPNDVFEEFKERAQYFCNNYASIMNQKNNIVISGFRIIEDSKRLLSEDLL